MYDFMETEQQALFALFGMPVYPFALFLTLGAALGVIMAVCRGRKTGLKPGAALTFACLMIPLGVICGRAMFCIFRMVDVMDFGLGYVLRIDCGGFSMIGVALGMLLCGWLTHVLEKVSFLDVLDSCLPGLLLVLAAARFAEGATINGVGPEITVEALQFTPLARQGLYGEYSYAVHLGEALTALVASVYLQSTGKRGRGFVTGMGVTIVAAGQILWESARRDEVLKYDFIRYGMLFSGIALLIVLVLSLRRTGWQAGKWIASIAGLFLLAGVCIAMEFFIDGKFLQNVPIWFCYLCDTVCTMGMAAICMAALRKGCQA